jgi:hypothetical protein
MGQKMEVVMLEFKDWHKLLNVYGAICDTNISMLKPNFSPVEDYFYHETVGYLVVA